MEKPINQRIKFLLESLSLSARDFSRAVGVPDNNTQNYLEPRYAQPKADYLEKVMLHFESISPIWLLTGQGEPFLTSSSSMTANSSNEIKKIKGNVQANTGDTVNNIHLEDCQKDLATAKTEIKALKELLVSRDALLASKDALIAAKDETITLLRASYTRPN